MTYREWMSQYLLKIGFRPVPATPDQRRAGLVRVWIKRKGKIMTDEQIKPLFPDVEVQLLGSDGNAYAVLGKVKRAMRRAGIAEAEIERFREEAVSGDYDHLIQTAMKWVTVS